MNAAGHTYTPCHMQQEIKQSIIYRNILVVALSTQSKLMGHGKDFIIPDCLGRLYCCDYLHMELLER